MSKTTKRLAGCLGLGTAACGTTEPLEWPLLVEFEVEVQYVKPDPGLVGLSLTLEDRAAEWQQYHAGGPAAGQSTHQRAVANGVAGPSTWTRCGQRSSSRSRRRTTGG